MNDQSKSILRDDPSDISQRPPLSAKAESPYHQNPEESAQKYLYRIPIEGYEEPLIIAIQPPGPGSYRIPIERYDEPSILSTQLPSRGIGDEGPVKPRKPTLDEEFERESTAFARLLPHLLRTAPGRFVAVYGGKVVDTDADEFALAERVQRNFRGRFVLIRCVSESLPEDRLESPEVE